MDYDANQRTSESGDSGQAQGSKRLQLKRAVGRAGGYQEQLAALSPAAMMLTPPAEGSVVQRSRDEMSMSVPFTVQLADTSEAGGDSEGGARRLESLEPGEFKTLVESDDALVASINLDDKTKRGGITIPNDKAGLCKLKAKTGKIEFEGMPGTLQIRGTIHVKIMWDTHKGKHPGGQADISGAGDPDITQANYKQVAADLDPNTSWSGQKWPGQPRRTSFWAQDLTESHEKYHATDNLQWAVKGVLRLCAKLQSKRVGSTAHAKRLFEKYFVTEFEDYVKAKMADQPAETRAYGDGKSKYEARASAIRSKGKAKQYPK